MERLPEVMISYPTKVQLKPHVRLSINPAPIDTTTQQSNMMSGYKATFVSAELATIANDMPVKLTCRSVSKLSLAKLFVAKCSDLRITVSKQQMVRFFEIFESKNQKDSRKLSFADMALGDASMDVIAGIIA